MWSKGKRQQEQPIQVKKAYHLRIELAFNALNKLDLFMRDLCRIVACGDESFVLVFSSWKNSKERGISK